MDQDPLVIRLERIGADGLDLNESVKAEWLQEALGPESPYRPVQSGRLVVHLQRLDGDSGPATVVHVRGRATIALEAECSRCVEPVTVTLDSPLEVALFPQESEPPAGPDGELRPEDMGVATYGSEGVDLSALVHDEVFLQLPMNPLCTESCAGLCPECGTNLNNENCACQRTEKRWNAFSDIELS